MEPKVIKNLRKIRLERTKKKDDEKLRKNNANEVPNKAKMDAMRSKWASKRSQWDQTAAEWEPMGSK